MLLIVSGNLVHNLGMVAWDKLNNGDMHMTGQKNSTEFNSLIFDSNHTLLINNSSWGKDALQAIPAPEHYLPLMYTLGNKVRGISGIIFNDKAVGGSLTRTSVDIG